MSHSCCGTGPRNYSLLQSCPSQSVENFCGGLLMTGWRVWFGLKVWSWQPFWNLYLFTSPQEVASVWGGPAKLVSRGTGSVALVCEALRSKVSRRGPFECPGAVCGLYMFIFLIQTLRSREISASKWQNCCPSLLPLLKNSTNVLISLQN